MGRAPCCDKANVKKGPWSPEEDIKLKEYIEKHGTGGNWIALPQKAGLRRCGKSCRLRWLNYLRPNIKHGEFSDDEDRIICALFASIGSRWSIIAAQLPGRTDNDIKNYWNTKLKKKLIMGMMPQISQSRIKPHQATFSSSLLHTPSSLSSPSSALSSSSPPSYKCSNTTTTSSYYTTLSHAAALEPPNNNFISIPSTINLQSQESFMGLMHHNNYQVKDSLLMFGGETSCSTSSDGSHGNKEVDQYEYAGGGGGGLLSNGNQQMGFQSYFNNNNGVEEINQKFMVSNGWSDEKPNGMLWGDQSTTTPLDYGLEEFKQLISTNICNSFLADENKTEERIMYY